MITLEIDKYFVLVGDADGDISLDCLLCDSSHAPIVFYTIMTTHNPYRNTEVVVVHKISDMFTPATKHIAWHRAQDARRKKV